MNFKRLLINRYEFLITKATNIIESIVILISSNYNRVTPPDVLKIFVSSLWSEDNIFNALLYQNTNSLKDAKEIISGKFKIFSEIIELNNNFIWNKDFFSNKIYPTIPYPFIKIGSNNGHDVIVAWEFSRLQFIPTLIQAHKLTKDEKFVFFFEKIIDDWILKNPYKFGVNWKCPMDVGIRSINMGLGVAYFFKYLRKTKIDLYLKVLWAHFLYIIDNESYKTHPNKKHNHYLVSSVSLLFLSLYFYGNNTKEYLEFILEDFKREIIHQFKEDGGNFESANHYHQFSLEGVLIGIHFLKIFNINNENINVQKLLNNYLIKERLYKSISLVNDYFETCGISPQFGDSSDGRILIFKDYFTWDPRDHNFLIELFSRCYNNVKLSKNSEINTIYSDSGLGFFKNSIYGLCINGSKINESISGHNHCDKGSFILQTHNIPILIDSGTYCYTSDLKMRNIFRGTRSHNTIMIDKKEQASFGRGAFSSLNKINFNFFQN